MGMMKRVCIFSMAIVFVGCSGSVTDNTAGHGNDADLRELARAEALNNSGKNDEGEDICEKFGFYADGFCDVWCAEPDSDCGPCDYPEVECAVDEIPVDTNDTGCADACAHNPDYVAPLNAAVGEACYRENDCADENAYCQKAEGICDDDEAEGVCVERPDCWDPEGFVYEPVCGCSGVSFGNACEAGVVGDNIRHTGLCAALRD